MATKTTTPLRLELDPSAKFSDGAAPQALSRDPVALAISVNPHILKRELRGCIALLILCLLYMQYQWHYSSLFIPFTLSIPTQGFTCQTVLNDPECKSLFQFFPVILTTGVAAFIIYQLSILKLAHFNFNIVEPGIELPHKKLAAPDSLAIATRLLHPRFTPHNNNIIDWLNHEELQGLQINILRAVLLNLLKNNDYITKIRIASNLHRSQIIAYFVLVTLTVWFAYPYHYKLESAPRYLLRLIGLLWWLCSMWLYQKQIKTLQTWLERTRNESLSIHLPIFIWEPDAQAWREITPTELHSQFVGNYGIEAEKMLSLTQTIFLVIYTLTLGLL